MFVSDCVSRHNDTKNISDATVPWSYILFGFYLTSPVCVELISGTSLVHPIPASSLLMSPSREMGEFRRTRYGLTGDMCRPHGNGVIITPSSWRSMKPLGFYTHGGTRMG